MTIAVDLGHKKTKQTKTYSRVCANLVKCGINNFVEYGISFPYWND